MSMFLYEIARCLKTHLIAHYDTQRLIVVSVATYIMCGDLSRIPCGKIQRMCVMGMGRGADENLMKAGNPGLSC